MTNVQQPSAADVAAHLSPADVAAHHAAPSGLVVNVPEGTPPPEVPAPLRMPVSPYDPSPLPRGAGEAIGFIADADVERARKLKRKG